MIPEISRRVGVLGRFKQDSVERNIPYDGMRLMSVSKANRDDNTEQAYLPQDPGLYLVTRPS